MIFKIAGVPFQGILPFCQRFHQLLGLQLRLKPFDKDLIDLHVLEIEDHIQFPACAVAKRLGFCDVNKYRLTYGKRAIRLQHLAAESRENLVAAFCGQIMFSAC